MFHGVQKVEEEKKQQTFLTEELHLIAIEGIKEKNDLYTTVVMVDETLMNAKISGQDN